MNAKSTDLNPTKKFTNAQWTVLKNSLTPEQIADFERRGLVPTRDAAGGGGDRLTEAQRYELLKALVGSPTEDQDFISINVTKLLDAGFPMSVTLAPYWSGVAGGSTVAWSLGWVSSLKLHRLFKGSKPGETFRLELELREANEEDVEARRMAWTKAFPKKKFPLPPQFRLDGAEENTRPDDEPAGEE